MGKSLLKNHARVIVLLIGVVVVLAVILSIFILLPIGPGLPPHDIRAYRFIPGPPGPAIHDSMIYPISVGKISSPLPLSLHPGECLHAEYGVSGTTVNLSADSCYFHESEDFQAATCELCHYLLTNGSIGPIDLHIKDLDDGEYDLRATQFTTDLFRGYFIVAERPFLSSSDDFYILYYGINDDERNLNSEELIQNLMGFADLNTAAAGSLGGLDCEQC
ncbi:MAG: hypothetical protein WC382_09320 [Methanoregulaceae archaeon]|jgi:hypothetical protein